MALSMFCSESMLMSAVALTVAGAMREMPMVSQRGASKKR